MRGLMPEERRLLEELVIQDPEGAAERANDDIRAIAARLIEQERAVLRWTGPATVEHLILWPTEFGLAALRVDTLVRTMTERV